MESISERPTSSSSTSSSSTSYAREDDPLLRDLSEKKQNFKRNVVSLAAELKEEAEAKAKGMEEEVYRLHKSLEERNKQLQASASNAEKYLQDLDDLKAQLNVTQATADASAASAQSAQMQCLTLLKDLDEKNNSIKEHEDRVKKLAEQLDALQNDLQVREFSQKQLKDEVLRVERDIMEAVAKAGVKKDCELRKILDEVSPKNVENMNRLLSAKDEEITQLRDEIRILSTHYKLKVKELEAQLEKHRKADQELKKRVLKLEFCLQEARSQTRKLQRMGERRDKAIKELREQLAMKQQISTKSDEKQNFWKAPISRSWLPCQCWFWWSSQGGKSLLYKFSL
ncbi:Nuclear envelope-associated protein 2 [Bienertia sinuspersici]